MSNEQTATEAKTTKSIVPAKYAGRYKNGGTDELANFIKEQCMEDNTFSFDKFFDLMEKNGIAKDKADMQVEEFERSLH